MARSLADGARHANPLIQGHSGPTAWMTPAYPYLLAGIFKLLGVYSRASALAILSLDSVFSALTVNLMLFIGLRQAFRRKCDTALPYALTAGLYPLVYYISHPAIRYRHVIDPEIIILAALGAATLFAAARGPQVSPGSPTRLRACLR